MVEITENKNENFVGYGRTAEGGLTRSFRTGPAMLIKGVVGEVVQYSGLEIEVIHLSDELLKDFDFEENFDGFGMWQGFDTALDCVEAALSTESEEDKKDSMYIWGGALIKAHGKYHIVTYDFFEDGLATDLV